MKQEDYAKAMREKKSRVRLVSTDTPVPVPGIDELPDQFDDLTPEMRGMVQKEINRREEIARHAGGGAFVKTPYVEGLHRCQFPDDDFVRANVAPGTVWQCSTCRRRYVYRRSFSSSYVYTGWVDLSWNKIMKAGAAVTVSSLVAALAIWPPLALIVLAALGLTFYIEAMAHLDGMGFRAHQRHAHRVQKAYKE